MVLSILFALILALTPSEALQKASGLYEENRYQEAIQTLTEELPAIRETQDSQLLGETLSLLASSYFKLEIFDKASSFFNEAYALFDREKNKGALAVCRYQQGLVALKEGFENLAANYLREARELSLDIGDKDLQKMIVKELSSLLRASDPSEATRLMHEYASLTDSIYQEKADDQKIREENIQKEVEKKDQDIASKEIQIRDLKTIRMLLILISGLLALALILVIWIATIRQKHVRMLQQTIEIKDRILQIHEEKSTLEEKHEKMSDVLEDLSRIVTEDRNVLTSREQEIAELCCQGLISKEIADRLGLSARTVETHKNNIFRKLGIHTTEELIQRMNEKKETIK